jgi:antitoxin component YwqK of YwqJK toxin-antitoxin module
MESEESPYVKKTDVLSQEINHSKNIPSGKTSKAIWIIALLLLVCAGLYYLIADHRPYDSFINARGFIEKTRPHGLWTYYYPNGDKRREMNYNVGILEGEYFEWLENNVLVFEAHYKNDSLYGPFRSYDEKGIIMTSGEYYANSYHGLIKEYDQNGQLSTETYYVKGVSQ